jgi:hypothetical protein
MLALRLLSSVLIALGRLLFALFALWESELARLSSLKIWLLCAKRSRMRR